MQSVGRLWLANIARGAWSGERAAVGWGIWDGGKLPPHQRRDRARRDTRSAPGESDSADRDRKSERR